MSRFQILICATPGRVKRSHQNCPLQPVLLCNARSLSMFVTGSTAVKRQRDSRVTVILRLEIAS